MRGSWGAIYTCATPRGLFAHVREYGLELCLDAAHMCELCGVQVSIPVLTSARGLQNQSPIFQSHPQIQQYIATYIIELYKACGLASRILLTQDQLYLVRSMSQHVPVMLKNNHGRGE